MVKLNKMCNPIVVLYGPVVFVVFMFHYIIIVKCSNLNKGLFIVDSNAKPADTVQVHDYSIRLFVRGAYT